MATLELLLRQYDGKIRLVFKNRPQTFHREAAAAAKAAPAVHKQGRFWDYHSLLSANSRDPGATRMCTATNGLATSPSPHPVVRNRHSSFVKALGPVRVEQRTGTCMGRCVGRPCNNPVWPFLWPERAWPFNLSDWQSEQDSCKSLQQGD